MNTATATVPCSSSKASHPRAHTVAATIGWVLVVYTVVIVLWGAWVRISGSGDGCGEHWPKCHGELIPQNATIQTWIEYIHRAKSGIFGLCVVGAVALFCRWYPAGSPARRWIWLALLFTISEALLGAALVIFGLVNQSTSPWRAVVMPLHLTNTLALLGSLVAASWAAQGRSLSWQCLDRESRRFLIGGIVSFLLVAGSGALAALSAQIAPAGTLAEGLLRDLSAETPILERLRMLHLPVAFLGAFAIVLAVRRFAARQQTLSGTSLQGERLVWFVEWFALISVLFGIATLISLSPVWMKLTHLALMNGFWIVTCSVFILSGTRLTEEPSGRTEKLP